MDHSLPPNGVGGAAKVRCQHLFGAGICLVGGFHLRNVGGVASSQFVPLRFP
jgi:hypothetical protein